MARIGTFDGQRSLTGASGFFFERDERLYLVTSRHVFIDNIEVADRSSPMGLSWSGTTASADPGSP